MSKQAIVPVSTERPMFRRDASPLTFLQQEIDRLFEGVTRGFSGFVAAGAVLPRIDMGETDKVIEITAELPGLETKDVTLNMADNVLTIRGEKKNEREESEKDYHLVERSYGSFSRSIELPPGVNAENISAEIAKGVLKVTVQKPAARVTKQIDIKSAA